MNVSDAIVENIRASGIKHVFGIPGHSVLDLSDAIYRNGALKFVTTRHEQVSTTMADGYARVSGKPAVAVTAAGPGSSNAIISVAIAYKASVPMLLITGDVPSKKFGREAFNEWETMTMFRPITKAGYQIMDPNMTSGIVKSALMTMMSGRPRPVHIDIPEEVGALEVSKQPQIAPFTLRATKAFATDSEVSAFIDILKKAERPVLLPGGGAVWSGAAAAVKELAESLGIPVATSANARGLIPEEHPLCFGLTGSAGYPSCRELVKSADVIICLGNKLDDYTTFNWTLIPKDAKVIQVDIDAHEIGKQYDVTLGIVADIDTFLSQVLRALKQNPIKKGETWASGRLQALRSAIDKERRDFLACPDEGSPVDPRAITNILTKVLRDSAITIIGAGFHARVATRLIAHKQRRWWKSGSFGSMGFAFPASLGAKLAEPDEQVVCIDGDGDFLMTVQDMETAVRENISTVNIIFNDSFYAAEVYPRHKGRNIGIEFKNPDFVKLAESFGATGITVTRSQDFEAALRKMLSNNGPSIIDVRIDRDITQKLVGHESEFERGNI